MKLKDCKTGMTVKTPYGCGIILPDRQDYITYVVSVEFDRLARIPIVKKRPGICTRNGATIFVEPEKLSIYRYHEPTERISRMGDMVIRLNYNIHDSRRI